MGLRKAKVLYIKTEKKLKGSKIVPASIPVVINVVYHGRGYYLLMLRI